MNFDAIISKLSLQEKIDLLAGKDNWHLNVPLYLLDSPVMLTDGPHGIRKQEIDLATKDEITAKATCFPTASLVSCSWDTEIFALLGKAIAEEASSLGVTVVLGPGLNIKKSGYNGRNFEYISEDPILTGKLASAYIKAAEACGVGTCVKHLALNNYETRRMSTNVVVDDRALREIYLKGFEIAIQEGNPSSVMSSYNRVNGEYASEHPKLLFHILRKEWKYPGVVMSDWGAVNNRVMALKSSLDLEMPGPSVDNKMQVLEAIQNKTLSIEDVDASLDRILKIAFKNRVKKEVDFDKHHELTKKIALESIVLLKNENNVLPLKKNTKIAVIGDLAKHAPIQGAGSSLVNPVKVTNFLEVLDANHIEYSFHKGYDLFNDSNQPKWIQEATTLAKESDTIVVFLGLDLPGDSEGQDRDSLQIPKNQAKLLESLVKLEQQIVVVLSGGSSVVMPWEEKVDAIFYTGLYGQNGASAIYELIYGNTSPSGKLSLTFPLLEEDDIFFKKEDIQKENVYYKDSLFVGYRYYTSALKPVRYAFGHGLSYSNFLYTFDNSNRITMQEEDKVEVSIKVKNTGNCVAKEVVQLYVENHQKDVLKPKLELKDFMKMELHPNQEKEAVFTLSKETFQHYCPKCKDWRVASGTYSVHFGSASDDLRSQIEVDVTSSHEAHIKDVLYRELYEHLPNHMMQINEKQYLQLFDQNPLFTPKSKYHENTTLYDIKHTIVGKIMLRMIQKEVRKWSIAKNPVQMRMIEASALHTPLRGLKNMSNGKFTDAHMEGVILWAKKNYIKSLIKMLFSRNGY